MLNEYDQKTHFGGRFGGAKLSELGFQRLLVFPCFLEARAKCQDLL
jgi:hypothetical protein